MKKIAVFFDKPESPADGIRVYCENLINLLNDTGMFQAFLFNNFEYFLAIFFKKSIYKSKSIEKYIFNTKPDYINVNGFMSLLPIQVIHLARKKKIPVIYTPHMHPFYTLNRPILGKIVFFLLLKPVLKYYNKIIVINNEEYTFFIKYNKNCQLIQHWINKPYLPQDKQMHKSNNLLFVGRNDLNKNLSFIYNLVKDRFIINCVTNKKPDREDFISHTNISDEELDILYDTAALVIIPSRYEAFSLVALEALSHGTPILISDRVRIVDHLNGVSGFTVFKYNDIVDFQNKLEIALQSKVDIKKIADIFSKEMAMNKYREVF